MTTSKARLTVYLSNPSELELLYDELRRLAPIDARGVISRSTAIEAAVSVALRDLTEHGKQSAIFQALATHGDVTNPAEAQP